jgi:PPOX class probable F420-dependent enzyme
MVKENILASVRLRFAWRFPVWSHMTAFIPETFQDLLKPETRALAHLALVLSDGNPQVTPIYFDYDGTHFVFNTARSRLKDRVMRKWPVVAFAISDPRNAYRYLQVRGRVVDETEEGAFEQACALNEKYHGVGNYPRREGEVRVTYKVLPERAQVFVGTPLATQ